MAFVLFSGLAACSSDDSDPAPAIPQTFLISKYTETHNPTNTVSDTHEFQYDASNRVVSELTATESKSYTYDSNGRIYKMETLAGGAARETIFTYNPEGKLAGWQRRLVSNNTVEERREFSYYVDRYEEKYFNIDGENVYKYQYYYTADKKNIAQGKTYYGSGQYMSRTDFVYDNKTGVESVAPYSLLPKPFHNANNATSYIVRNDSDQVIETGDINYEFNAVGMPVKSTKGNYTKNYEYTVK